MTGQVTASSSKEVNAIEDNCETKVMLAQLRGITDPQLLAFPSLQTKLFYKDKNGKQYKPKDKTKVLPPLPKVPPSFLASVLLQQERTQEKRLS